MSFLWGQERHGEAFSAFLVSIVTFLLSVWGVFVVEWTERRR